MSVLPYRGHGGLNPRTLLPPEERRGMFYSEWADAKVDGRSRAAAQMLVDPEARRRVESVYGLDYCRRRYPEVYSQLRLR